MVCIYLSTTIGRRFNKNSKFQSIKQFRYVLFVFLCVSGVFPCLGPSQDVCFYVYVPFILLLLGDM